jgi:hypothetical protein
MPTPRRSREMGAPPEPDQEPVMPPPKIQTISNAPPKQQFPSPGGPPPDKEASRGKPRFDGRSW